MRILVVEPLGRPLPMRAPPRLGARLRVAGIDFFDLVSVVMVIFSGLATNPVNTPAKGLKMKIPKLKAYYTALSATEYHEFETSRRIEVSQRVTINPLTGAVSGRRYIYLAATPELADTDYRARTGRQDSVWVLRVPADQIRRDQLTQQGEQVWVLSNSLHLTHCGVLRFDLAKLD